MKQKNNVVCEEFFSTQSPGFAEGIKKRAALIGQKHEVIGITQKGSELVLQYWKNFQGNIFQANASTEK